MASATKPRMNPITGQQEDPLGFLDKFPSISKPLRETFPGRSPSSLAIPGVGSA